MSPDIVHFACWEWTHSLIRVIAGEQVLELDGVVLLELQSGALSARLPLLHGCSFRIVLVPPCTALHGGSICSRSRLTCKIIYTEATRLSVSLRLTIFRQDSQEVATAEQLLDVDTEGGCVARAASRAHPSSSSDFHSAKLLWVSLGFDADSTDTDVDGHGVL